MTTTDLLIPASVAVVLLLGAVNVWRVSRRRRAAVSFDKAWEDNARMLGARGRR